MTSGHPDEFESAVQRFVSQQNGDLTPRVVYEMLICVDRDGITRHQQTLDIIAAKSKADKRQAALVANRLTRWQAEQEAAVAHQQEFWEEHCMALIDQEHAVRHAQHLIDEHAPRRTGDGDDEDHREERRHGVHLTGADPEWTVKVKLLWGAAIFLAASAVQFVIYYVSMRPHL